MEQTPPYYKHEVLTICDICNWLLDQRQKIDDRKHFARLVVQELFENNQVDLCMLRPKQAALYEDATHLMAGLIGFDSSVFKTICADWELFEHFLRKFCEHAQRSLADAMRVEESIYIWLLTDYLDHLLPVSDNTAFAVSKNSSWFSSDEASRSSEPIRTPLRLLKPEVLANSTRPQSFIVHSSTFRKLYPSLFEFVPILVDYYASLNAWPSLAQLVALRTVVHHYNRFLLAETEDRDLTALKRSLAANTPFARSIYAFVSKLLENWPLDRNYGILIELWLALVYPGQDVFSDDYKLKLFVHTSAAHFADLVEIILDRFLDANVAATMESGFLDGLLRQVFHQHMLKIFKMLNFPIEDYLQAVLHKLKTFHDEHRKLLQSQNETSLRDHVSQFFRSFSGQHPIDITMLERHINTVENKLYNTDSTRDLALSPAPSDASLLTNTTTTTEDSYRPRVRHPSGDGATDSRAYDKMDSGSPLAPMIPDHTVDNWTKMLFLTPLGRYQASVLHRRARFDYAQYAKEISQTVPTPTIWENGYLLRRLHQLSLNWSGSSEFLRYLKTRRHDSKVAKTLSKVFLSPASPPRYAPAFSKDLPRRPVSLNLRIFASYPFWTFVALIIWWLCHVITSSMQ